MDVVNMRNAIENDFLVYRFCHLFLLSIPVDVETVTKYTSGEKVHRKAGVSQSGEGCHLSWGG